MTEARIECLCHEHILADLNLTLHKGDVVWLEEARAKASRDLLHARRIRAVQVTWQERCQVSKQPSPPWLRRPKRVVQRLPERKQPEPKTEVRVEPAAPKMDVQLIARAAREAVRAEMTTLRNLVREEVQAMEPSAPQLDEAALERALAAVLARVPLVAPQIKSAGPMPTPPKGDDEPIYIPTGIVSDTAKAEIKVTSESSEGEGLEDAAAALRAAKGGRKRRRKGEE